MTSHLFSNFFIMKRHAVFLFDLLLSLSTTPFFSRIADSSCFLFAFHGHGQGSFNVAELKTRCERRNQDGKKELKFVKFVHRSKQTQLTGLGAHAGGEKRILPD